MRGRDRLITKLCDRKRCRREVHVVFASPTHNTRREKRLYLQNTRLNYFSQSVCSTSSVFNQKEACLMCSLRARDNISS